MTQDRDFTEDGEFERIDEYLDCTGKKRRFRLQGYARGMFLDATEILDGEAVGMRFTMKMDEHGHLPIWKMCKKVESRVAERDLAVDPGTKQLKILRGRVRGMITDGDQGTDDGPTLVVDDRTVTWRELGELLASDEGSWVRLQILDPMEI